ncbi:hypothetical protein W02_39530 [Nitrospira sp. KM1]|uniref:response regulator n=1 Tax=Nitrospira sp. KM1 TaxID=1936990 RepID=UPI0013A741DA|nr:response regulator transcription factor [Nitrospira sp. KM1]BCA56813.1 hypothetical protein W02_39530 [Nitrospira sp. KM1]
MSATTKLGPIRVLLVDDHAGIRQALRNMLSTHSDIHVVGEAFDGEDACRSIEPLNPSVVVMDLSMPRLNGVHATRWIKKYYPHIVVVGLSVFADDEGMQTAMKVAGAVTLISKVAAVERLHEEIIEAMQKRSSTFH